MNIGILTFHWATNYGAILQCYALQNYLISIGHNVKIINYKPSQFDKSTFKFIRNRDFLNLKEYINTSRKERALQSFRNQHLNLTARINTYSSLPNIASQFDLIISGSDQVANPTFLMAGEGYGVITPTYFIGFPFEGKSIGYALSFGCIKYPEEAKKIASKYIKKFNRISVRESSGINIIKSMGRNDAELVPDPTLLMPTDFYNNLADKAKHHIQKEFIYCFFIRHISERKFIINKILKRNNILWNNEEGDYTMQGWLSKIKHSQFVITDSFHCVVMCLKLHTPFIVITEEQGNIGMNDRLYTLLNKLDLCKQIYFKDDIFNYTLKWTYDWNTIDLKLNNFSEIGKFFLNKVHL